MNSLTQRLPSKTFVPNFDQRLTTEKEASEDWYVGPSDIDGQGVFAGKNFEPGETVGVAMIDGGKDDWDAQIWNLTVLGRRCNHQSGNNVAIRRDGDRFQMIAEKPINQDDELVADYRQVTRAAGPHSRMQWNGEDIPTTDFEDYVEKEAAEKKWYHSCCGKPAGECPGCPGGSTLVVKP